MSNNQVRSNECCSIPFRSNIIIKDGQLFDSLSKTPLGKSLVIQVTELDELNLFDKCVPLLNFDIVSSGEHCSFAIDNEFTARTILLSSMLLKLYNLSIMDTPVKLGISKETGFMYVDINSDDQKMITIFESEAHNNG